MDMHVRSSVNRMVPHASSALFRRHFSFVTGVLLFAGFTSTACEKVPLVAPANTVITMVSGTNVLPINGSTDITAVLVESGSTGTGGTSGGTPVHNGTTVTFTTSLGKIEPVEAKTENGRVTVKLQADGRSGRATVTAFSGAAKQTLEVVIGAAAAERVAVTAAPTSVPANGGTAVITARVEDATGNPLFSVPVTFTTTAGTLSAVSGLTNEAGIATTNLSTTAAATVTASAGGKTGTAAITIRSPSSITLTAPSGTLFVGAPASFTVNPGSAVRFNSVSIDFGDGQRQNLGAITGGTSVVHFYQADGVFTASVTGADIDGGTATAQAGVAVVPISFSATASPTVTTVNTPITLSVTGLSPTVPIERYEWDFGDGSSIGTTSASISRSFPVAGVRSITVTVVPLYGPRRSSTIQVTINP